MRTILITASRTARYNCLVIYLDTKYPQVRDLIRRYLSKSYQENDTLCSPGKRHCGYGRVVTESSIIRNLISMLNYCVRGGRCGCILLALTDFYYNFQTLSILNQLKRFSGHNYLATVKNQFDILKITSIIKFLLFY